MTVDLSHELAKKTAQLAALREIGRAINTAWELEDILQLITHHTADVMGMDSCSIYLLDDAGEYLVLKATTGLAAESIGHAHLRRGEGLTGWAAEHGEPVGVADASRDPRFKYLAETQESRFQSLLAVPLVNQGRPIGAINVQTKSHHSYAMDETELLSLIADLVAGALEKALLYDRMQRQIGELSTLAEVSETVTSPLYLDQMLALIVDMATQVMRARLCSLRLLDEERGELVLRATQSQAGPRHSEQPTLKVGQGIAGLVAQSGQPMMVEDVRADPRYYQVDLARELNLCSLLCVPLRVRERTIGVFSCYTSSVRRFSGDEVALFSTLANQTALAIENARLVTNAAVVREMHHRVKNNLQSVAMLLQMQISEGEEGSPREVLSEAVNRIQSIAAVHEILSERGFRLIDVKDLLHRVARGVLHNMATKGLDLSLTVDGPSFTMSSQQATALGLVVNELVQNAVEHGFAGRSEGRIVIELAQEAARRVVTVRDDGTGLQADGMHNLGLRLVETLVSEDLRGEFELRSDGGTLAIIHIPVESS